MKKIKDFFNWCVAGVIVGFIGASFLIGTMWIICNIVEKICYILGA